MSSVKVYSPAVHETVVVDTLPPKLRPDPRGEYTELAFRLWRLRRDADLPTLSAGPDEKWLLSRMSAFARVENVANVHAIERDNLTTPMGRVSVVGARLHY